MSDYFAVIIAVYLLGVYCSFLMYVSGYIEGYSVIWWPITLIKELAKAFGMQFDIKEFNMKQLSKEIFIGFLLGTGFTSIFFGAYFYAAITIVLGIFALGSLIHFNEEMT